MVTVSKVEDLVQLSYLILVHKCSCYNWFIASCDSSKTPCNDVGNAFVKPVENECKYAKITYVNCGWRNGNGGDPRSYEHHLSRSENNAWKKFRPVQDLNHWPLGAGQYVGWFQLYGFIWNQHNDQSQLAQLVERCTGIAQVMDLNPVQAWTSFRPYFHFCLRSVHNCMDRFHIRLMRNVVALQVGSVVMAAIQAESWQLE